MRLDDLDYRLPRALIAQTPAAARSGARLLVVSRVTPERRHATVADLPELLHAGDLLVLNDSRVIPARVRGRRPSGGRLEVLFVRPHNGDGEWEALVRGTPRAGEAVHFPEGQGEWLGALGGGRWRVRPPALSSVLAWLDRVGEVPLPPYIERPAGASAEDQARYQTVFARVPGAVAAPTAGLHFDEVLLRRLREAGVETTAITLHVGPGTFQPIRDADLNHATMGSERFVISPGAASAVEAARRAARRVVAVGTTTVRALESATGSDGRLTAGEQETSLFVRPGHRFRCVDVLLTNFHLPRSPLLALVSAFAGWEHVRAAYDEAVRERYRFYSFGDAMLIT